MLGVSFVDFEESPSNGSLGIVVKVFCSTSKVPFIIGRLQFNKSSLQAMLGVECQENPSKGSRGTTRKVLCSLSNVPS